MLSDKEVLEACITKAIEGGWKIDYKPPTAGESYMLYIFNHDFAKALWGEEWKGLAKFAEEHEETTPWQYRLQQLATSEDRISYLRENA